MGCSTRFVPSGAVLPCVNAVGDYRSHSVPELVTICARDNHPGAWEEFVKRFQPVIAGTVWRTLSKFGTVDSGVAEDLVQETFLRLCNRERRALREFVSEGENGFYGFVKSVAVTSALDWVKRAHAKKRRNDTQTVPLEEITPPVREDDPLPKLELRAVDDELKKGGGRNAERDRKIFWLHHEQGFTPAEIAADQTLELKEKGIETLLLRLTRRIRTRLAGDTKR